MSWSTTRTLFIDVIRSTKGRQSTLRILLVHKDPTRTRVYFRALVMLFTLVHSHILHIKGMGILIAISMGRV